MENQGASFEYDVALSFAGENRDVADSLAGILTAKGLRVFYDRYEQADLWGKDLYQHLQTVYRDKALVCVVFVSEAYTRKLWTRHELRQAQERAFRENREYILPLRLDDARVPGISETTGYLDLRSCSVAQVADLLEDKLTLIQATAERSSRSGASPLVQLEQERDRRACVVFEGISQTQGRSEIDFSVFNETSQLLVISHIALEFLYVTETAIPRLIGIIEREEIAPGLPMTMIAPVSRTILSAELVHHPSGTPRHSTVVATYKFEPSMLTSKSYPRDVTIQIQPRAAHSFGLVLDHRGAAFRGILAFVSVQVTGASAYGRQELMLDSVIEAYRDPGGPSLVAVSHHRSIREAFSPLIADNSISLKRVLDFLETETFSGAFLDIIANNASEGDVEKSTWERLLLTFISRARTETTEIGTVFWNHALTKLLKAVPRECVVSQRDLFSLLYRSQAASLYRLCGARVAAGLSLAPEITSVLQKPPSDPSESLVSHQELRAFCKGIVTVPLQVDQEEVLRGVLEAIFTLAELGGEESEDILFGIVHDGTKYRNDAAMALALAKGKQFSGGTRGWVSWCIRNRIHDDKMRLVFVVLPQAFAFASIWVLNGIADIHNAFVLGVGIALGFGLGFVTAYLLSTLLGHLIRASSEKSWRIGLADLHQWYGRGRARESQQDSAREVPSSKMTVSIRVTINAPVGRLFEVLLDPKGSAIATGAIVPKRVPVGPITAGVSWTVWTFPWHRVRHTVTKRDWPNRIVKQLSGSIIASIDDRLVSVESGTALVREVSVSRVPSSFSTQDYCRMQQQFLRNLQAYFERSDQG